MLASPVAPSALVPSPESRPERRRQLKALIRELERRRTPDDLHPKQRIAFDSTATEILYGGAAGGGKSHLFRRAAITWCRWVPGLQVYLFRRNFPDLFKNHMDGPGSFPMLLADDIKAGRVKIEWGNAPKIRFVDTSSTIHLCHLSVERKDLPKYQGAEIHVLMIDELTQWSRNAYTYLRSRVRLGGLRVPKWLQGLFPRILCGANPGGIGHNWVKADWVDLAPEQEITEMPSAEGGMRRQFIRALLEDNPTMTENDPEYEGRLEGMDDKALARAMRKGDWDIVAGGMLDDLWSRDVHVLPDFDIPRGWKLKRAFDWGSSKPFSVGWWAVSDGSAATMADGTVRHFARGTVIRIAEWYGCEPKRPNEGLKMLAVDIAKDIVDREARWKRDRGWTVRPGPADSSIYDVENGKSIAADMERAGVKWVPANKGPGSRKTGWEALRRRLKHAKEAPAELPGLFVFASCTAWIRTVPVLPRDEDDRDDVDTDAEDHTGDETRYLLLEDAPGEWKATQVVW